MTRKSDLKHRQTVGYKYIAKTKPSVRVVMEVPTSKPPPEAHFVKYKRLCHPADPDVSVSKRPKVKEVQELYRKFTEARYRANHNEHNWKRAEAMLKRALAAGLNPTQSEREAALLGVMRDFLAYLSPPQVGEWTGTRWLDTNFTPKMSEGTTPNDKSFTVDQTSVTLDQWGDHIAVNNVVSWAKKKTKTKRKWGPKAAKRSRR